MTKLNLLSQRPNLKDIHGRVLPPLIMYMFGVPASICILLWFFFFRG